MQQHWRRIKLHALTRLTADTTPAKLRWTWCAGTPHTPTLLRSPRHRLWQFHARTGFGCYLRPWHWAGAGEQG